MTYPPKPAKSPGKFETQEQALAEAQRLWGERARAACLLYFPDNAGPKWVYGVSVIGDPCTVHNTWSGVSFESWEDAFAQAVNGAGQKWSEKNT